MRCTKCGYISFDYLDNCKKCGMSLSSIRAELCPMERPPSNFFVWEWLGLGIGDSKVTEIPPSLSISQEVAPPLEISLEDQTEEIIITDEAVLELEDEEALELEPSMKELEKAGDLSIQLDQIVTPSEKEMSLEEGISFDIEKLSAEDVVKPEIAQEPEVIAVEDVGITEQQIETPAVMDAPSLELETAQPLEAKKPKAEKSEEEEEIDEALLSELDKILGDEKE